MHRQRRPGGRRHGQGTARIRQHQRPCPRMQQARRALQRRLQAHAIGRGRAVPAHQGIEYAQHAAHAARRWHQPVGPATAQGRHAVAVVQCRPGRDRAGTRGLHRLEPCTGAEIQGWRGIGHQQGQPFTLGLEGLGVGEAGARAEFPVDVPGVVAGHVLARLGVLHAAAALRGGRPRGCAASPAARAAHRRRRTPQRDQLGQRGDDAVGSRTWRRTMGRDVAGHCHRPLRVTTSRPRHGNGTRSSSAATRRSPSQPSAAAS